MIDVDVIAPERAAPRGLTPTGVETLCALALASAGVDEGHVAVEFVEEDRIRELNRDHRGRDTATDVLSFPVDENGPAAGPRELGDVVICPEQTEDLAEAVIHGTLHLTGLDHETDDGEMLALQAEILRWVQEDGGDMTRSGFVAICGRPNVGKSTLINSIVGQKVAIVSDKPQTTRRAVRGVANGPDWQLVLVDLPGVQKPRDELTGRMQRRVESELTDADAALVVVNAVQGVGGPGDRFIAGLLENSPVPVVVAVNKIDGVRGPVVAEALASAAELFGEGADYFPVSARKGTGVPSLVEHTVSLLPEGPYYFGAGERSDQSEDVMFAELVREQVLSRTRQEVPHAVEVEVEEIDTSRPDLVVVRAHVWVETDSQKGIVIGAGGRMIKQIGTGARRELERRVGGRVHLDLSVRVKRHWRDEARMLDRLGIE